MKKLWTLVPVVLGLVFLPGGIDRVQTAETEWASVKRRPSAASRSMLGVFTLVAP